MPVVQHPTHLALNTLSDDEMVDLVCYANQSFRNMADKDYICARTVYRLKCSQQFLWLAEQAVEKYLKAILLYNFVPTMKIGHNLDKAFELVTGIPDLPFDFSEDIVEFIGYLNHYGPNRYLERPMMQDIEALQRLDKTVWYIRKWCYFIRALSFKDSEGKHRSSYASDLVRLRDHRWKRYRHCYRIVNGYLEKVIKDRLPGYSELVWKNFYYGRRAKRSIIFEHEFSFESPLYEIFPESFPILAKYVRFPKEVADHYSAKAKMVDEEI